MIASRIAGFARIAGVACVAGLAAAAAWAQAPDSEASAIWQKVRVSLFADRPIGPGEGVVSLEVPERAADAAVVPIAIHAGFPQSAARSIERVWLVIDNNPSPIAAVFRFTQESGRADIETRVRIDQYTHVRAIAATNDGELHMATRYVKASGGCSAPAATDAAQAKASLGRMSVRVEEGAPGGPERVQLLISHPNDSGLAMDQLTRTYAPSHFVRSVEVRHAGRLVMSADVDFSISENPYFRFYLAPGTAGALETRVVDNHDLEFTSGISLAPPAR
jgi:sulfur-oxidizing protein SoxY